jgi:hypothetical protein
MHEPRGDVVTVAVPAFGLVRCSKQTDTNRDRHQETDTENRTKANARIDR